MNIGQSIKKAFAPATKVIKEIIPNVVRTTKEATAVLTDVFKDKDVEYRRHLDDLLRQGSITANDHWTLWFQYLSTRKTPEELEREFWAHERRMQQPGYDLRCLFPPNRITR